MLFLVPLDKGDKGGFLSCFHNHRLKTWKPPLSVNIKPSSRFSNLCNHHACFINSSPGRK